MYGKGYCVVCGAPFGPSDRSDKLTCSDVCRSRRSRFKKRIASQITTALDAIYDVATITQGEQFTDMAFSELDYLVDYAKAVHADLIMRQSPRKWWEEGRS